MKRSILILLATLDVLPSHGSSTATNVAGRAAIIQDSFMETL